MKQIAAFVLLGALLACAPRVEAPPPSAATDVSEQNDATRALHAFFAAQWDRRMRENPTWASSLGDLRFNREWADESLAAHAARHAKNVAALKELEAIEYAALGREDQVSAELASRQLRDAIRAYELGEHLMPLNHRGGVQTLDSLSGRLRVATAKDYDDYLARLKKLDRLVEQTIELMNEGLKRGITQPRIVMERVPRQIAAQVVDDPKKSGFFSPFADMSDELEGAARLRSEALDAIENLVVPAYRRFQTYFNDTYLPACRTSIGASSLPNGDEWYAYSIAHYTTTELTAEEIHQIGLDEVARIRGEMAEVMKEVEFDGDFAAFLQFLRTDPQFFYETPEELFDAYLAMSKRIDPELVKLFGRLPRIPYGVVPIPDSIAPDTTTAYYMPPAVDGSRAGYYNVNLYDVKSRPKWEIAALTVHEAVPGHHLQIALSMEQEGLPQFRKVAYVVAFGEGWALYSERLGYEMGIYDDPYDRFGQLTYDMWRAVRLVVDTGMHAKGWTRQQAIDFFMENAPKAELDIVNEIDRYIAWPGQALAYKIGQLEILRLRAEAEKTLGEEFDIRGFHDVVLGSGGVPLDVLAENVERWIAEQKG